MNATEKQTAYANDILSKLEGADNGRLAELPAKVIIEMKGQITALQPKIRVFDDAESLAETTQKILIGGRLFAAALEANPEIRVDTLRDYSTANAGKIASCLRRGNLEKAQALLDETQGIIKTNISLDDLGRDSI